MQRQPAETPYRLDQIQIPVPERPAAWDDRDEERRIRRVIEGEPQYAHFCPADRKALSMGYIQGRRAAAERKPRQWSTCFDADMAAAWMRGYDEFREVGEQTPTPTEPSPKRRYLLGIDPGYLPLREGPIGWAHPQVPANELQPDRRLLPAVYRADDQIAIDPKWVQRPDGFLVDCSEIETVADRFRMGLALEGAQGPHGPLFTGIALTNIPVNTQTGFLATAEALIVPPPVPMERADPGPIIAAVRAALLKYAVRQREEARVHAAIRKILEIEGIAFQHEHTVGQDRFDFFLDAGVVLEIKVQGGKAEALRQAERYTRQECVGAVLIVATSLWAKEPTQALLNGKRVEVISLATDSF